MTSAASNNAKPTRSVTVIVVSPDGPARQEEWSTSDDGGLLKQLQAAVAGSVDVVALSEQVDMWVNDEGLYLCESNPVATALALAHGRDAQPYFGTAVFTGGADGNGATVSLLPAVAEQLLTLAALEQADEATKALTTAWSERFARPYRN